MAMIMKVHMLVMFHCTIYSSVLYIVVARYVRTYRHTDMNIARVMHACVCSFAYYCLIHHAGWCQSTVCGQSKWTLHGSKLSGEEWSRS